MENEEVVQKEETTEKKAVEEKKGKGKKIFKIVSILIDILIVPVIIVSFLCTILAFNAKSNNEVPSIFGMSIVTIVSDSMEPDYKVGDVMVIKKADTNNLKVGDICT